MGALHTPASEGLQTVYHSPRAGKKGLLQNSRYTYTSHERQNTICGLRIRTFFVALVLAMLIVLAAVGGGVGGSIAARGTSKYVTFASAKVGYLSNYTPK